MDPILPWGADLSDEEYAVNAPKEIKHIEQASREACKRIFEKRMRAINDDLRDVKGDPPDPERQGPAEPVQEDWSIKLGARLKALEAKQELAARNLVASLDAVNDRLNNQMKWIEGAKELSKCRTTTIGPHPPLT